MKDPFKSDDDNARDAAKREENDRVIAEYPLSKQEQKLIARANWKRSQEDD